MMIEVKTIYLYLEVKTGATRVCSDSMWLGEERYSTYDQSYYLLSKQEIEFPLDIDLRLIQIEGLESVLEKEIADSQIRQTRIKGRIAELQCLTHDIPPAHEWPLFNDDIPF